MRASVLALVAAVSVAAAAANATSGSPAATMLTFKVVTLSGERHVLSRHVIDPYAYSLSPDHNELAYIPQTCNGCSLEPTMVAAVGTDGERVLAGPFQDVAWAPNGRQIALTGTAGSEHGLFLVRPDGRGLRHIADTGGVVWSPDSTYLASERPISIFSLATGQERYLSPGYGTAWSPDQTRIAFAHNSALDVVSLGTGTVRDLTRGTHPNWSPDGRRIAFIRYVGDAYHLNLWVMSSRGGTPRRLARGLAPLAPFLWSPNGRQIAYVRGRSLFATTLSGGKGRFLARESGDITPLAWSPNGRQLLYFTLVR